MTFLQVAILTAFSAIALIVALYCLFFMVPVKRFYQRIRSLGGGLKGTETLINGVRDSVTKRLDEIEGNAREQLDARCEELRKSLDGLTEQTSALQRQTESLRKDAGQAGGERRKLSKQVQSVNGRLQQLRSEVDALEVELRQTVRQEVADSFSTVESTVLAALEAVQEEILYGTSTPSSPPPKRTTPPRTEGHTRTSRGNIITVEPLFTDAKQGGESEPDEGEAPDSEEDEKD